MLTDADRTQMTADLLAIRDDRSASIVIRRGAQMLPAQTVRVAGTRGGSTVVDVEGAQATVANALVVGDATLDIQPNDRFTLHGVLYQVLTVHPNRDAGVRAYLRAVQ